MTELEFETGKEHLGKPLGGEYIPETQGKKNMGGRYKFWNEKYYLEGSQ